MRNGVPPSFSRRRKFGLSVSVLIAIIALIALVGMINYLSARHYKRLKVAAKSHLTISPMTEKVLASITNELKVIVYFDREEPLYDSVWEILKEYKFRNNRLELQVVDYTRDPGAASLIRAKYNLRQLVDKDMVIFDHKGQTRFVYHKELSDVDIQPLVSGQSKEVKRTAFKGELLFTSAILSVTSSKPLRAYFLQGHGEHNHDSDDADMGYLRFAEILKQNNVQPAKLSLIGENDIPSDCSLLIVAGPRSALPASEITKIDQYLKNGGRMLTLFNFYGVEKPSGLEKVFREWGIDVGQNVVRDRANTISGQDVLSSDFGAHAIVKPLIQGDSASRLHLVVPRAIGKVPEANGKGDAPLVSELVFAGPDATVLTDIRNGEVTAHPLTDIKTNACLAVALEKGKIRDLSPDRGTTRVVVVGESLFLANRMIDSAANHDFATLAVNWLLDRSQLLAIPPRPIAEYKLMMTKAQLSTLRWILLVGMPASVLLAGLLVSVRRRR